MSKIDLEESRHQQYEELRRLRETEPFKTILRGWKVYWRAGYNMQAQVYFIEPKKQAYICEWGEGKVPSDYILHEMLHVIHRAMSLMSKDVRLLCEELLIQYLCYLIKKRKGCKLEVPL